MEEAAPAGWPAVSDDAVTERAGPYFLGLVERRAAGEPLQYVLGHWGFRTLDVMVDRRVLIPRPETEQVVEVALQMLDRSSADPGAGARVAVDLGTGSGVIALSLAAERPGLTVWATDVSADALAVASANLSGLGGWAATGVRLAQGSWWDALPGTLRGQVALAVSNPPYVTSAEMGDLDPVVRNWEPAGALDGGPEGLDDVARIVQGAPEWLAPGGGMVIEIAPTQAIPATELALGAGLVAVEVHPDLSGRPRALAARRRE